MIVKPGFFGRLFADSGKWTAALDDMHLYFSDGKSDTRVDFASIQSVIVGQGVLWPELLIILESTRLTLKGLSKKKSNGFRHALLNRVSGSLFLSFRESSGSLTSLLDRLNHFYRIQGYLSNHDVNQWRNGLNEPEIQRTLELLTHPLFDADLVPQDLSTNIHRITDLLNGNRQELQKRNESFVRAEMERWKSFFDTVESRPLTEEQKRAAIILEDRNLLIAAAGSGKSSTVVAKIGYALATRFCQPQQILALAFNRSAAHELDIRIDERLGDLVGEDESIASRTFHRLGMDIIAVVEGKQPDIAPWAGETRENEGKVIDEIIKELVSSDKTFMEHWVKFLTVCFSPNIEIPQFKTLQEYNAYLRQVGEKRDGRWGIRTLNGDLVKSMEETAIANWLFINGIPYQYERAYEYETADLHHRQYHPDFYFPEIDCYHEHFALDEDGRAPAIFAADYEDGVYWKRKLHTEKQTALIETTSAMYRTGKLFTHLEQELTSREQVFRPRSPAEILARLAEQKQPSYSSFIRTFITLCKSNSLIPNELRGKAEIQRDSFRAQTFLDVVDVIYRKYQEKLLSLRCVDFEDMIRIATRYVQEGKYVHPFRLILVDEFQDISYGRAALVNAMLDQNPDCRLFAVGDDWQSIYRFTGSDIGIMARFPDHFGVTATNYLTRTFRSNQGITNVAATFVQKNEAQLRKNVNAVDPTHEATIQILEYVKDEDVEPLLESELVALADIAKSEQEILKIFLLGRYNHLQPALFSKWKKRFENELNIKFLSLHRSKGLESDYVFILGVNSGSHSFPSGVVDDPLLDLVLPEPEKFEDAEERRLFYVGLTRAKRRTYLLTKKSCISKFVPELLKPQLPGTVVYRSSKRGDHSAHAVACTSCGTGILRVMSGPYGKFMGCSNYPECTKKVKFVGTT